MKKEIAEIWITALESGKYEQTTGVLKDHVGYCCLGVLCDISGLGTFGESDTEYPVYTLPNDNFSNCSLPFEVLDWADISDEFGSFDETDSFKTLSVLNDSGKSFTEIAEIIRNNYQSL